MTTDCRRGLGWRVRAEIGAEGAPFDLPLFYVEVGRVPYTDVPRGLTLDALRPYVEEAFAGVVAVRFAPARLSPHPALASCRVVPNPSLHAEEARRRQSPAT